MRPFYGPILTTRVRGAQRRCAFTLTELVIVIVIIGVISSMAIPRLSRGAEGAAQSTLEADLNIIRHAIELYAAEHNNTFPGTTGPRTKAQLTQYSTAGGNTSPTRAGAFRFGPYLMRIPPAPVGDNAGSAAIAIDAVNSPPRASAASSAGWVYNPNTGEFYANTSTVRQGAVQLVQGL